MTSRSSSWNHRHTAVAAIFVTAACAPAAVTVARGEPAPASTIASSDSIREAVLRGRQLAITHVCGDCHGGFANPNAPGYLAGVMSPDQEFQIGPFKTRPRNITPDNATGIGRFTERQIFNALRYGLRPGETPDVEITSMTPGQGNFPANPKYLAPPMPWPAYRHMTDQELRDIATYLKRGVKPVNNRVADSDGPPDFWVSAYTVDKIGTYPLPAFPAGGEREPE
jgi:mono/diheme cytochrome c family protein